MEIVLVTCIQYSEDTYVQIQFKILITGMSGKKNCSIFRKFMSKKIMTADIVGKKNHSKRKKNGILTWFFSFRKSCRPMGKLLVVCKLNLPPTDTSTKGPSISLYIVTTVSHHFTLRINVKIFFVEVGYIKMRSI